VKHTFDVDMLLGSEEADCINIGAELTIPEAQWLVKTAPSTKAVRHYYEGVLQEVTLVAG
jgi:hypothetical protein